MKISLEAMLIDPVADDLIESASSGALFFLVLFPLKEPLMDSVVVRR
jgi:hypothetical protein